MLSALRKVVSPPQASARPPSPSSPIEGNALFEALVCDFHWTALEIGAITCCMNASLISGQTWMLRSCRNLVPIQNAVENVVAVPPWLEADHDNFTGRLLHTPGRDEIDTPVEEQLIIEFYSR